MSFRPAVLIVVCALAPTEAFAQKPAPIPAPVITPDTSAATRREALKAELEKMVEAQANHFARHRKYAANMAPTRHSTTSQVFLRVTNATATGWSAVATSLADTSLHCGIYEGTVPSPNPAVTRPKTPGCW